jgi:hypothetical protein
MRTSPSYSLSTGTSQAAKPNKNARHTKKKSTYREQNI